MILISDVLAIFWVHFLADFVLQSRRVATHKSSSNAILGYHVAIYMLCFFPFGILYAFVNAGLHFITDYFSSRATSRFYQLGNMKNFWYTIGLDQAIHLSCLISTFPLFADPIWKF